MMMFCLVSNHKKKIFKKEETRIGPTIGVRLVRVFGV